METLSVHNHFTPTLGSNPYHQYEIDYQSESTHSPTRNWTTNNRDRASLRVKQTEGKIDSHSEERRSIEESISNENLSTVESCVTPPRENSPAAPAVFVYEPFVADTVGAIDDDDTEREYFMRSVVIGAENIGKHSLIDASFPEDSAKTSQKNGVNLLIKTAVRFKSTKKYHFWIRTLNEKESCIKEAIWKTYYKCANSFVFVYDTTDEKSFEVLEEAIKNVQKVVPKDKFFGILVGTKNDLYSQRQVDYSDVVNLKERYNLNYLVETNSSMESETPQVLPRIDTKLKLTFESI